ncbi:hypothetical protein BpHYR1_037834 [Brachionus plicatilis]|uniref:Uncharacterized protein n=1 Tax=Brachionus plicatilis TaxID=10195 RepID=A0A3M7QYL8_BRAPC|nr:hypothetical protein BpHYR1_037834 [Brachionus plicatilis]
MPNWPKIRKFLSYRLFVPDAMEEKNPFIGFSLFLKKEQCKKIFEIFSILFNKKKMKISILTIFELSIVANLLTFFSIRLSRLCSLMACLRAFFSSLLSSLCLLGTSGNIRVIRWSILSSSFCVLAFSPSTPRGSPVFFDSAIFSLLSDIIDG